MPNLRRLDRSEWRENQFIGNTKDKTAEKQASIYQVMDGWVGMRIADSDRLELELDM
jgi:hypothetical protein